MLFKKAWWVTEIDFRISSGIIFSFLLLIWGDGERRKYFPLRFILCSAFLICSSYFMRLGIETHLPVGTMRAFGHSMYLFMMCIEYMIANSVCYKTSRTHIMYTGSIVMTVYRLGWSTVKAIVYGIATIHGKFLWNTNSPMQAIFSYFIYFSACALCRLIYRHVSKGATMENRMGVYPMFLVFVLCQMALEFAYYTLGYGSVDKFLFLFFTASAMYSIMTFPLLLMLLYVEKLQKDKADMESFIKSKQEYYQISHDGILSLQTKCHDLKHQIALIRSAEGERQLNKYMDKLEDSIDEYNTVIDTGNQSLDVVLTEKNIICNRYGIRFTYMVDGTWFNFLDDMDIYSLFGNALENAIESQMKVKDEERRFISLRTGRREDLVVLTVENYYEHELLFKKGELITNKLDEHHHGFGVRSIRNIATSHGGNVTINADDNHFKLTITMKDPAYHTTDGKF